TMLVTDPIEKPGVTGSRVGYELELRIVVDQRQRSRGPDGEPVVIPAQDRVVIQNSEPVTLTVGVVTKHVQNKRFVALLQQKYVVTRHRRSNHLERHGILARQLRVTDRQFQDVHTFRAESRKGLQTIDRLKRDGPRSAELGPGNNWQDVGRKQIVADN